MTTNKPLSPEPLPISDYQMRFIETIIQTAKLDKDYANWSIKHFAQLDPCNLSNLKAQIIQEVARRKALQS